MTDRPQLPAADRAFAAVAPPGDGICARTRLQQRLEDGHGRVVECLTLRSGRRLVVKTRNDRAQDREAFFYQHLLPRAGDLVPAALGHSTIAGMHLLVLDQIDGRSCDSAVPDDRERAMAALAHFHCCFPGSSVAAILGPDVTPELQADVTPDPLEQPELLTASRDALADLAAVLPLPAYRQAEERMEAVAAAIAASPLLLDPGDVRPENVLLGPDRTVLLDFENVAIRRSGLALAAMLEHWPDPDDLLGRYLAHGTEPSSSIVPAVRAGQEWLALHAAATRITGGDGVPTELVQRLFQRSGC